MDSGIPAKKMAAAKATKTPRGPAPTTPSMAGVLWVMEEEVRGLSVPRLRLLIYLLQGQVPQKPGNISYAERAIRILAAETTPFFAAQWTMVQGLPPTARHDPVLFRQFKESADETVRADASSLRAQFVPTPVQAASVTGSVDGDDNDWHSVEGPLSDL